MQLQQNNEIIKLDNVVVSYDRNVILPGVSLNVNEGDFIAVTGPNGGGKTSLLRVILGLVMPESGKVCYYDNGKCVKKLNIGYREASIGNLSGGQLQRVLFARSIVSSPSVLVLDEPLSYVDKSFEAQFYEIVEELAKKTTIILVSHEMARIMQMANRHIIVDRGIEDCHAHRHFIPTDCE